MTPIQKLEQFLRYRHSYYGVNDVVVSNVRGYLNTTKPYDNKYLTIGIGGVGYSERDNKGRFISPYQLWRDLICEGVLKKANVDFITGEITYWE
jgi:hypothetical protein